MEETASWAGRPKERRVATRIQAGSFAEEVHRRAFRLRQFVINAIAHGLNTPRVTGKHRQVAEQMAEIAVAVTALEIKTREFVETLRATNVIPMAGRRGKIRKVRSR
jgi:hypothetical protein